MNKEENKMENKEMTEFLLKTIQEKDKKIEDLKNTLRKLSKVFGIATTRLLNVTQRDFIKASFLADEIRLKKEKNGSYSINPKKLSFSAGEIPDHIKELFDKEEEEPGYIHKNCYFINILRNLETDIDEETKENEEDKEEEESEND